MYFKLIAILLGSVSLIPGQSARRPYALHTRRSFSMVNIRASAEELRLVKNLRARGAAVSFTNERISQPFFSVGAHVINVNGEGVQVFAYAQARKGNHEAKRVSSDGLTIGSIKPYWMATPHFFKTGKLIVLYVGDNQSVLRVLQSVLGNQCAGG